MKKKKDLGLAKLRYDFKMGGGKASFTPVLEPNALKKQKAMKNYYKKVAVVELNGVPYDADVDSIAFMSSVLSIANFRMLEAMANGASTEDAYNGVTSQTIPWKDANGKWSEIAIRDIPGGLEAAMRKVAELAQ